MNTKALKMLALAAILLMCLAPAAWAGKVGTMNTPLLSCGAITSVTFDVNVCAGATTGAPAGFSLQWVTAAQLANGPDGIAGTLDDNTWPASESLDLCKASFSGNANGSSYNLAKNQCTAVQIGDNLFDNPGASSNCPSTPLLCGTTYAVRGFAHANSSLNRSAFTANLFCTTSACETEVGCTYTQGYWKTHGPIPTGNNVNEWPVTSLTLGNVTYTDYELLAIFNNSGAGNGLVKLAHQLIAAKLNVANGAWDSSSSSIAAADAMIGNLVVPPVGTGSLSAGSTSALVTALTNYNEGATGPGHCN